MRPSHALALCATALAALSSCHKKTPACAGVTTACTPLEEGASEAQISAAFATAQPGATIAFGEGTFSFKNTLNAATSKLTIKGAGIDKSVLDFKGQTAGSDGILVLDGSDGITVSDLTSATPRATASR